MNLSEGENVNLDKLLYKNKQDFSFSMKEIFKDVSLPPLSFIMVHLIRAHLTICCISMVGLVAA